MRFAIALSVSAIMTAGLFARRAAETGLYGGPIPAPPLEMLFDGIAALLPIVIAYYPQLAKFQSPFKKALDGIRELIDAYREEDRAERAELKELLKQIAAKLENKQP